MKLKKTSQRRVPVRLRVDPAACDAYGYCAELLPERVTLDEWGYPVVDGTPVEASLAVLAKLAVAECPRRALHLQQVSYGVMAARDAGPAAT